MTAALASRPFPDVPAAIGVGHDTSGLGVGHRAFYSVVSSMGKVFEV